MNAIALGVSPTDFIFSLNSRFNQVQPIRESEAHRHRPHYCEGCGYVFALDLHKEPAHQRHRDCQKYLDIFHSATSFVKPPWLTHFNLKPKPPKTGSTNSKRNRDFEFNIRLDYLENLNEPLQKSGLAASTNTLARLLRWLMWEQGNWTS